MKDEFLKWLRGLLGNNKKGGAGPTLSTIAAPGPNSDWMNHPYAGFDKSPGHPTSTVGLGGFNQMYDNSVGHISTVGLGGLRPDGSRDSSILSTLGARNPMTISLNDTSYKMNEDHKQNALSTVGNDFLHGRQPYPTTHLTDVDLDLYSAMIPGARGNSFYSHGPRTFSTVGLGGNSLYNPNAHLLGPAGFVSTPTSKPHIKPKAEKKKGGSTVTSTVSQR